MERLLAEAKTICRTGLFIQNLMYRKLLNETTEKIRHLAETTGTCTSEDSVWIRTDRKLFLQEHFRPDHSFLVMIRRGQSAVRRFLTIQAMGLKKRLAHTHAKSAVVGISGGLDSTLALLVTAKAFDALGT